MDEVTNSGPKFVRKRYFVKPGFQSRLTTIFLLMVIIVANIVGAMVYAISMNQLEKKMVQEWKLPIESYQVGQTLLPGIILAEIISVIVVAILSIFVTHTIAGPVYRMERVARSIGKGDLTNVVRLRTRDELKDLAQAFNEMTEGLVRQVKAIKASESKFECLYEEIVAKDSSKKKSLSKEFIGKYEDAFSELKKVSDHFICNFDTEIPDEEDVESAEMMQIETIEEEETA
ncbi:HAMP domain-containing protein [Candidatus Riflebacteria bacterium]